MLLSATVFGQTKTLTGKTEVVTGTVEAIQADTRIITVKGPKGDYVDIEVPKELEIRQPEGGRQGDGSILRELDSSLESAWRDGTRHR